MTKPPATQVEASTPRGEILSHRGQSPVLDPSQHGRRGGGITNPSQIVEARGGDEFGGACRPVPTSESLR